jgi:glycosyltransferase involved in cell wall biosynthesis
MGKPLRALYVDDMVDACVFVMESYDVHTQKKKSMKLSHQAMGAFKNMRTRLMHIVQSPGGVERYISMLLKYMGSSKYEQIIVCSYDYKKENFKNLVNHFENVEMIRKVSLGRDLIAVLKVRKLINKYKPDIVYMHSSKAGAIGRIANIGIKNKTIYNPHGWAFNMDCSPKKKKFYIEIEKVLAKSTDLIIAISDAEKKVAMTSKICKPDKVKVILSGIDIEEYSNWDKSESNITKESLDIPSDSFIIGTVGRISHGKAPDTFVKAAAEIKKYIPNAFFIIVGDGEDKEGIQSLIYDLNLDKDFLITGWVNNVLEYVGLFDVGMLLTRWEGFGLALAEYMVSGVPIIATNVGAIPELIIHDVNGILVEIDNIQEIKNAAVKIYASKQLRNKLVKNGLEVVKKDFDVKRVALEHEKLIESLFS